MNTLDKLCLGWLIAWFIIGIILIVRIRRGEHKPFALNSAMANLGFAVSYPMMLLAYHHEHGNYWWDVLVLVVIISWVGSWLWPIWREGEKEREKAIAEGRIRAVYNDWAKPDSP